MHSKEFPEDKLSNLMLRMWRHISSRRRSQFLMLLCLMIVVSFSEILTIGALLPFLMALTSPQSVFTNPLAQFLANLVGISDAGEMLLALTVSFGAASLIAGLLRVSLLWFSTHLSSRTGADLSIEIYRRTLYQPYAVHVSRNTSEVISGVIFKANHVVSNVFNPMLTLASSAVMLVAILGTLLFVDYVVALSAVACFGLIYGAIIKLTRKRLIANSKRTSVELTAGLKTIQEGLGGIRDVLIDGSQDSYAAISKN